MSEWQDISTAPRNGTRLLLLHLPTYTISSGGYDPCHHVWYGLSHDPTHWQALPAPPKPEKATQIEVDIRSRDGIGICKQNNDKETDRWCFMGYSSTKVNWVKLAEAILKADEAGLM